MGLGLFKYMQLQPSSSYDMGPTQKSAKDKGFKSCVLQNSEEMQTQALMYFHITRCTYLRVDDILKPTIQTQRSFYYMKAFPFNVDLIKSTLRVL